MLYYLIGTAFVLCVYYFIIKPMNYWHDLGVKYVKPIPFFGNMFKFLVQREAISVLLTEWYNMFPNERYFGGFKFNTPILYIKDPKLIKNIAIKDFDHFMNHTTFVTNDGDALWSKNLFAITGDQWRDMRSTLSPSFTGSKMKLMFNLINDCSKETVKYYEEMGKKVIKLELKDFFTRFSNDVIATCAFGVEVNSFKDKGNEFYKSGLMASDFTSLSTGLKFLGYNMCPAIMRFFNIKFINEDAGNYFSRVIKDTIKIRQEKGIVRPDMVHLLMEAKEQREAGSVNKAPITIEDLTANAMIFFSAGFNTSATLMAHAAYELAINRDCQAKLYQEVQVASNESKGELTYEIVSKMKYLDMVLQETLRKWPPSTTLDRKCGLDYVVHSEKPEEKTFIIKKGISLIIPAYSLHWDPKYFPEPEKFDPERFSDENKDMIEPGVYVPFGIGPRICLGSRFALLETKAIIFHMMSKFEFVPTDKTMNPMKLCPKHFEPYPVGGFHIALKRRNN